VLSILQFVSHSIAALACSSKALAALVAQSLYFTITLPLWYYSIIPLIQSLLLLLLLSLQLLLLFAGVAARALGELMDASHASCRDLYDCSCEELEALVAAAKVCIICLLSIVCTAYWVILYHAILYCWH
jgi:hypothetical protein